MSSKCPHRSKKCHKKEAKCVTVCDKYLSVIRKPDYRLLNKTIDYATNNGLIRYIPARPPTLPDPPFFPQTGNPVYPWYSNILPSKELTVIPDAPSPPYPAGTPAMPNKDGYEKYKSISGNFY